MGLYPITINTTPEQEPHIFAQDDATIYQSICGNDCVFNIGSKFKSTTLSNNKIRLSDGVLQVGGHIARIKSGDYEDVTIANGVSGKKRVDIICCRFQTNGKIDNMQIVVKQGVAGELYKDPVLVQNDLYSSGQVREMPLYRVKIDGINIVSIEQMFTLRENLENNRGTLTTYPTGNVTHVLELSNGYIRITGRVWLPDCEYDPASNGYKKVINLSPYNIDMNPTYIVGNTSFCYAQGFDNCAFSIEGDNFVVKSRTNVGALVHWSVDGRKKVN